MQRYEKNTRPTARIHKKESAVFLQILPYRKANSIYLELLREEELLRELLLLLLRELLLLRKDELLRTELPDVLLFTLDELLLRELDTEADLPAAPVLRLALLLLLRMVLEGLSLAEALSEALPLAVAPPLSEGLLEALPF